MIHKIVVTVLVLILAIATAKAWFDFNTLAKPDPTRQTLSTPAYPTLKMCLLRHAAGPCRAGIKKWYFNPKNVSCMQFRWGGCQGNGNRFDSEAECYDTCSSAAAKPSGPPRYCQLTFDYGYCFGGEIRYYWDKLYRVCKETIYSGCGGNKNNFYNIEQCDQVCRFGLKPIGEDGDGRGKDGLKKVIIIDPVNATTRKTAPPSTTTACPTAVTETVSQPIFIRTGRDHEKHET